jgi:hypothetical protein
MCYAPPESTMAEDALAAFTGEKLALIGEWDGDTGSSAFEHKLLSGWDLVEAIPLPNWSDTAHDLTIWHRRPAELPPVAAEEAPWPLCSATGAHLQLAAACAACHPFRLLVYQHRTRGSSCDTKAALCSSGRILQASLLCQLLLLLRHGVLCWKTPSVLEMAHHQFTPVHIRCVLAAPRSIFCSSLTVRDGAGKTIGESLATHGRGLVRCHHLRTLLFFDEAAWESGRDVAMQTLALSFVFFQRQLKFDSSLDFAPMCCSLCSPADKVKSDCGQASVL